MSARGAVTQAGRKPTNSITKLSEDGQIAIVKNEIRDAQEALLRLKRSSNVDAEQRREWESRSNMALKNAYVLGANTTIILAANFTQRQIEAQDKEMQGAVDQLSSETEPSRRQRLHLAYRAMSRRRGELTEIAERLEKAHDAIDVLDESQTQPDGKEESDSKTVLESAWDAADKLNVLPRGAGIGKIIVDSFYDIAIQAFSVRRVNALNGNADSYLKAVRAISRRIETLEKIKRDMNRSR